MTSQTGKQLLVARSALAQRRWQAGVLAVAAAAVALRLLRGGVEAAKAALEELAAEDCGAAGGPEAAPELGQAEADGCEIDDGCRPWLSAEEAATECVAG